MDPASSSILRIRGGADFRARQLSFATDGVNTTSSTVSNTAAASEVDAMTGRKTPSSSGTRRMLNGMRPTPPPVTLKLNLPPEVSGTVVRYM